MINRKPANANGAAIFTVVLYALIVWAWVAYSGQDWPPYWFWLIMFVVGRLQAGIYNLLIAVLRKGL